jgi:hypothetical protein
MRAAAMGLSSVLFLAVATPSARAATRLYAIAIGNNAALADDASAGGGLHYADDDAAAFYEFARGLGAHAELLTDLDDESQLRFPDLASQARAPTFKELQHTVGELRVAMSADVAAGNRPVLLLFYSGHGLPATDERPAALSLLDEGLTTKRLYDDVLAALPEATIHILVDACYAEDVVRPRDLELHAIEPTEQDVEQLLAHTTLARFPRVGAIIAAATSGQTHEWDQYHQGVFTHELLSGLRGAADVNDDGAVEYSELGAFLSAANREVPDLRARLRVISHPPPADRRLPIVELQRNRQALRVRITGGRPDYFFIEDRHANRLVEMRSEDGYSFHLYLPADQPLYFVSAARTVEFQGRAGDSLDADSLAARGADLRARGAMSAALRHGLFAAPFGPSYYRGFVDRGPTMLSVDFHPPPPAVTVTQARPVAGDSRAPDGWVVAALSAAGTFGIAAATFQALAVEAGNQYDRATLEREATDARHRVDRDQAVAVAAGVAALSAAAAGGFIVWRRHVARTATVQIAPAMGSAAAGAGVALRW